MSRAIQRTQVILKIKKYANENKNRRDSSKESKNKNKKPTNRCRRKHECDSKHLRVLEEIIL